jgi:hypothetical protein
MDANHGTDGGQAEAALGGGKRRRGAARRVGPRRNPPQVRDPAESDGPVARVSSLAVAFSGRVRKRPLTSLAVAIGVGFVVGGALSFRAGRLALTAAARHLARELLKQVL